MATRDQVRRAIDRFEDRLGKNANVVGLGIVPDPKHPSGEPRSRGLAVAVYVKKKLPVSELSAEEIVPKTLEIPGRDTIIKVPTQVIEQGEVTREPA